MQRTSKGLVLGAVLLASLVAIALSAGSNSFGRPALPLRSETPGVPSGDVGGSELDGVLMSLRVSDLVAEAHVERVAAMRFNTADGSDPEPMSKPDPRSAQAYVPVTLVVDKVVWAAADMPNRLVVPVWVKGVGDQASPLDPARLSIGSTAIVFVRRVDAADAPYLEWLVTEASRESDADGPTAAATAGLWYEQLPDGRLRRGDIELSRPRLDDWLAAANWSQPAP